MTTDRRLVRTADGTRIFAELHGGTCPGLPLLCLPGLTRNGRDFEPVVEWLQDTRPVLTLDFRGRGRSDHAHDPLTYRPDIELADTIAVLQDFGFSRVALLGTSRGGIVGLLMSALNPDLLAGLCLNDIGPRVEPEGLLRIMGYVGKDVAFADWDLAAHAYAAAAPGFADVSHERWLAAVRRSHTVRNDGKIVPQYDARLASTLPPVDVVAAGKTAELWELLPALADKPVTCLRGAGSDLLTQATLDRLVLALPHTEAVTVPQRGHVPFLDEPCSVAALNRWLGRVDAKEKGR